MDRDSIVVKRIWAYHRQQGELLMLGLISMGATAAVIVAFAVWAYRRWDDVDSYYERKHQDPPVADLGSYLHGDRGF